ncbi:ATP12 family chaperone protein [Pseudoruegeria sp. SHC-113]|uniref:ATP12 family chaperone protein n=1 Tax=Pseudoruegeria sp. SHC-113 TaxID=2855439 RepID=UPI0021BB2AC7|nr:ATP12 family protein [Pseudoruegeria sp. SHC-113]MCT8161443.1 ATPase [Pseudoruegeria sp. SHC-113]
MAEWKQKRFWKEATAAECDGGFEVLLDGRRLKTPGKAALVMPTLAMAQAVAEEWAAQEGEVQPLTMPVTRSANSAIDKVSTQFDDVAALIAAYGETDLLCYRAEGPAELIARQAEVWDPLLDWLDEAHGARLGTNEGVMFFEQDPEALARLRSEVFRLSPFELTAFHDLVGLSGSLVIGLAAIAGQQPAEALWAASRIDETWQAELWGEDEEAQEMAQAKKDGFLHADRFYKLTQ